MDKKQGEFVITFSTKGIFTIAFDNDEPVGEGVLDISRCRELGYDEGDNQEILINDEDVKHLEWSSEEIKGILKKTRKLKRGKYFYYSNPER